MEQEESKLLAAESMEVSGGFADIETQDALGMADSPSSPKSAAAIAEELKSQLGGVLLGQEDVIEQVLASFLANGHVLIEGKPGLGKTHLVVGLAKAFKGQCSRIQFTPDLMPTDVTGFTLFDMKSQTFQVRKGPVFTNLLLADEINRAPAKTQAALLEVMAERQVTIDGETMPLAAPFMTLATQNPIEQEGTYPLPEAQLDRFLMKVVIDYPSEQNEVEVVKYATSPQSRRSAGVSVICTPDDIIGAQKEVAAVKAVDEVVKYAVDLVRTTRSTSGISLGAGTRGAISLISIAKAYAVMNKRDYITPDDVKSAALPVLRHRIALSPELAMSGQNIDEVLLAVIASVEAPRQ